MSPTQAKSIEHRLIQEMAARAADGLDRRCPPVDSVAAPRYRLDGKPVLGFCSNDYLGLAQEYAPGSETSGSTGSRLVSGHRQPLRELERHFAEQFGFPAAVLFPSGYQANVAALSCLLREGDVVASDALNHASLIDGIRLSAARATKIEHLATPPLVAHTTTWWITESRFSMDGDGPSPEALASFMRAGGALYLDEAHTFGLGPEGDGIARTLVTTPTVTVLPLGKAVGAAGAFVAGSEVVCEYLRTSARGVVYSTAPAPPLLAAIRANLDRLTSALGETRRATLRQRIQHLHSALHSIGLNTHAPPESPIVPIVLGHNERALAVSAALLEQGFHVQPIRYPTVPRDQARLRLTVTALHEPDHIDALASALGRALDSHP